MNKNKQKTLEEISRGERVSFKDTSGKTKKGIVDRVSDYVLVKLDEPKNGSNFEFFQESQLRYLKFI